MAWANSSSSLLGPSKRLILVEAKFDTRVGEEAGDCVGEKVGDAVGEGVGDWVGGVVGYAVGEAVGVGGAGHTTLTDAPLS